MAIETWPIQAGIQPPGERLAAQRAGAEAEGQQGPAEGWDDGARDHVWARRGASV
jgi:hypothetical protein